MSNIGRNHLARRTARGTTLAEIAPSLTVLCMSIVLPLFDLTNLAVGYGACLNLNHTQLRKAATLPEIIAQAPDGPVKRLIPNEWRNSGPGQFITPLSGPDTIVTYYRSRARNHIMVAVTTRVTVKPLFPLPLIDVPGLSTPITYEFSNHRPARRTLSQG